MNKNDKKCLLFLGNGVTISIEKKGVSKNMEKKQGISFSIFGNYKGRICSFFSRTDMAKLEYDILEISFCLKVKLRWYIQNKRRKTEEEMDEMVCNVSHYIDLEELFAIPLFKKMLLSNPGLDEIDKAKLIRDFVNSNEDVMLALISRYENKLVNLKQIEENGYCCLERICDYKTLIDNFENQAEVKFNEEFTKVDAELSIVSFY